jgi:hypothetical protein
LQRGSGIQRQLQSAAHGETADGRDDRFGAGLDVPINVQRGLAIALGVLNSRMSAPLENPAGADDDDGLDTGVGARAIDPGGQAAAQLRDWARYRRVVGVSPPRCHAFESWCR